MLGWLRRLLATQARILELEEQVSALRANLQELGGQVQVHSFKIERSKLVDRVKRLEDLNAQESKAHVQR